MEFSHKQTRHFLPPATGSWGSVSHVSSGNTALIDLVVFFKCQPHLNTSRILALSAVMFLHLHFLPINIDVSTDVETAECF